MSDFNDYFDDMIDVDDEAETEAAQYLDEDGDDEDEEDDSPFTVRTAVLAKNDMIALLSLKAGEAGAQIVRLDPRETLPTMQRYENEQEAARWFGRSLATSRRNGWAVVYDGEPLAG